MKEGKDYDLIPADVDNEQGWDIRFTRGELIETVIRFGNVSIDGTKDCINFNFKIVTTPDADLTEEYEPLQIAAGQILSDVIENHIKRGSILLEDKQ